MESSYTAAEVAKALDCSIPTVYGYENKGILRKVPDPHKLYGASRFKRESGDKLKQEKATGHSWPIHHQCAQTPGILSAKSKGAISSLKLEVQSVPSNI